MIRMKIKEEEEKERKHMQVYICLRCDNGVDKKKDFVEDMRVKRKQG